MSSYPLGDPSRKASLLFVADVGFPKLESNCSPGYVAKNILPKTLLPTVWVD